MWKLVAEIMHQEVNKLTVLDIEEGNQHGE